MMNQEKLGWNSWKTLFSSKLWSFEGLCASMVKLSERGVTANIPVLGTGDSGFESRRSDHIKLEIFASARLMLK